MSTHFIVILSAAKELIAACHGHEILHCAQDDSDFAQTIAFALKEIDIEHLIPLGPPSYAKASEGILLRATALQRLFCVARSAKQNGGWGVIQTHGN